MAKENVMGEIADMMLEGTLCEGCGVYLEGDAPGYPRYCSYCCGRTTLHKPRRSKVKKVQCKICKRLFRGEQGIEDHMRVKHGQGTTEQG